MEVTQMTDETQRIILPRMTVYAAKFLCGEFGREPSESNVEGPVKPGNYATAINIHNPHPSQPVFFRKKGVLLFAGSKADPRQELERPRPPGHSIPVELGPDWGMEIDCFDIRKRLIPEAPDAPVFIKGWVVLESFAPWPLDVEAVHTGHTFLEGKPEGFSMTTERITGTSIPLWWPASGS
jgi:hypothetical protein